MPNTPPNINVNYVLSFAQIESLIEKIKLNTEFFNIINVFYHDQPLPEAAECGVVGAKETLRLVIPRIATYLGNTYGTDETFKELFCTTGTSEAIGDFKIKGEQYTVLANRSFDGAIKFLKTQKFDGIYKKHFDRRFLYFVRLYGTIVLIFAPVIFYPLFGVSQKIPRRKFGVL